MKSIQTKKKIRLKNPVLVAAWPGMGDVALKAAAYLKDKLKATEFATMSPNDYFHPTGVWVEGGLIETPQPSVGHFYFYRHPSSGQDLVLFISDAQPFVEKGHAYAQEIIDFAKTLRVKEVYTFAAMPLPMEHTQPSEVHVVVTKKELLAPLEALGVKTMATGQISGLNGLILGVAKSSGLDGACLLGEIPLYTVQIENPLASLAVLDILTRYLKIELDLADLRRHAEEMNREIEHLIDYLKNPPEAETDEQPIDQKEIDIIKKTLADAAGLPDSAKHRIDELFRLAKKDLARALELKKELDKWSVYDKYEDSFLDLFKKRPKKNN